MLIIGAIWIEPQGFALAEMYRRLETQQHFDNAWRERGGLALRVNERRATFA